MTRLTACVRAVEQKSPSYLIIKARRVRVRFYEGYYIRLFILILTARENVSWTLDS